MISFELFAANLLVDADLFCDPSGCFLRCTFSNSQIDFDIKKILNHVAVIRRFLFQDSIRKEQNAKSNF